MHTTDGSLVESDSLNKQLEQFKQSVSDGLNSRPKSLSSMYFYDEIGDKLFVEIMAMPEYYLTNAEMEIFSTKSDLLIDQFDLSKSDAFELIELGAGDGTKTAHLLKALVQKAYNFTYRPIDISQHALDGLSTFLRSEVPQLQVSPLPGNYFDMLESLSESNSKKVVLFLGSNIGNMNDDKAADFLSKLGSLLNPGDILLLGVDTIKSREIVLPAYNDAQGITARFNLNLLHRINKELGGNFDLTKWSHHPTYTEDEGIARSFLRSEIKQTVEIKATGETFDFEEGELINTEISRKYNDEIIDKIIAGTSLKRKHKIQDSNTLFSDYILRK